MHYHTVENGVYDVKLHFCEIWSGGQEPDARKFNVWVEGDLVLEEYDMYAMYGGYTAIIESFTTTVDDGGLTIDFIHGSVNNPKVSEQVSTYIGSYQKVASKHLHFDSIENQISAIEIHPAAPSSAPSISNAPSASPAPTLSTAPSSSPTVSPAPNTSTAPSTEPSPAPTLSSQPSVAPSPKPSSTPTLSTLAPVLTTTTKPQDTMMTAFPPDVPPAQPDSTAAATEPPTDPDGSEWIQVGRPIDWMKPEVSAFEDNALAMSLDGKVVAIGQTQDDSTDDFSGRVALYKDNEFFGWTPLGDNIDIGDDPEGALFGYSVSLNEDGKVVAIGDPGDGFSRSKGRAFVYECNETLWQLKGNVISPVDDGEEDVYAGRSVSLSADGNTVAVEMQIKARTPGPPTFARVLRYDENSREWKRLGQDIFGRLSTVNDPFSIDLCKDGTSLAISSLVPGSGYVEMYKYRSKSAVWTRMGDAIEATSDQEAVGITVAMSTDGQVVAFGARLFESSNLVRVYKFVNEEWVKVGADINSKGTANARRLSLSMSGDGSRVAVGPQDSTAFSTVFGWNGEVWSQIGSDIASIEMRPAGLQLQTIAMSEDGDRVAVFAPGGRDVIVYENSEGDMMLPPT